MGPPTGARRSGARQSTQATSFGNGPEEFQREKGEMDYLVRDPAQPEPVLDAETRQEMLARYEQTLQKEPDRYKDMLGLKGY